MELWETIAAAISEATGERFSVERQQSVGGGCINSAYCVSEGERSYFVKLNRADGLAMFEAEADGLRALKAPAAIKVPEPVATGVAAGQAYIAMEDVSLGGSGSAARLGRELAELHRTTQSRFGWFRDNTIGSTPQYNTEEGDWISFWREQRLGAQLAMAARNGHGGPLQKLGEELMERFPALFTDYSPEASLLHGDLWSGNYAYTRSGDPVIFDPAVYFGDREADIAMTELFGGFGGDFYAAYEEAWPLDPGYRVRKSLYNLYHILNHFNMFGGGYGEQSIGIMKRLLSELR
jgi:fructosamine-3-kinase